MRGTGVLLLKAMVYGLLATACGSSTSSGLFTGADGGAGTSASGGSSGAAGSGAAGEAGAGASSGAAGEGGGGSSGKAGSGGTGATSGSGGLPGCDAPAPDDDVDGDGFTKDQGDCDECSADVNPGAYDFRSNGIDEDCSAQADDEPKECDDGDIADADATKAARAIGICRTAENGSWGLVSAKYVLVDGTTGMAAASHGLLPDFGPNMMPREGQRMLALSSGTARRPTDTGYLSLDGAKMGTTSGFPGSYPLIGPFCSVAPQGGTQAFDPAALEIVVRTPTNVKSLAFDFDFYSYEFPLFVCSMFFDSFAVIQTPEPSGALSGGISHDAKGNAVSVDSKFMRACTSQTIQNILFDCPLGTDPLVGTGFDVTTMHAASGWLVTRSAVSPGTEATLRFAIWDSGDDLYDSTVLIDAFRWSADEVALPSNDPAP